MIKRFLTFMVVILFSIPLIACGSSSSSKGTVGISMPSKSQDRWEIDGNSMMNKFKDLGYDTDMQYAQGDSDIQIAQIKNMIDKGVDLIVIAPVDATKLSDIVDEAHKNKIKIVDYDGLIMNTDNVDYYASFDNKKVGELQGEYIADKLGLTNGQGPFNIELFVGSQMDNNSKFFYNGAMSILQQYIDSGKLVVKSGEIKFEDVALKAGQSAADGKSRISDIVSKNYENDKLDAVLVTGDTLAVQVMAGLTSNGYGTDDKPMPIVTGQDAALTNVKSIINGIQSQTVFKDTRKLAETAATMADAILNGEDPEINDTETYDNGKKVVPANLLTPVSVDINNYKSELVDSGYYKEDMLKVIKAKK